MARRKPGQLLLLEQQVIDKAKERRTEGILSFYGYDIAKVIHPERRLRNTGTIYRCLRRLETMGLLESWWSDPGEWGDQFPRRMYMLTDAAGR